jgi:hypothetical protein
VRTRIGRVRRFCVIFYAQAKIFWTAGLDGHGTMLVVFVVCGVGDESVTLCYFFVRGVHTHRGVNAHPRKATIASR